MARINVGGDRKFTCTEGKLDAILSAAKKMLTKSRPLIEKSVDEAEDHKLTINITVEADASQTADKFPVKIRFTTGTYTDQRVVKADEEDQGIFKTMTLEELHALEKKAKQAEQQAEQGDPDPEDGKPKKKRASKGAEAN